jgi:hypothetical protein
MPSDIQVGLILIAVLVVLPMLMQRRRRRLAARRRRELRDANHSTEAVINYLRAHFDP